MTKNNPLSSKIILPLRLQSIDVFRAITMLLMIFVNDLPGVKNLPEWIDHAAANEDRLGFADIIFPAFLFIVGLSLPFAITNRLSKGKSIPDVIQYILIRSVALLVMGFFHVNFENYSKSAFLPYPVYTILVTISFFLIWLDYSPSINRQRKYSLIGLGLALLILMIFIYRGGTVKDPVGMRTYWWGILGIIGWAYLVVAFIFLMSKGNLVICLFFLLFFMLLNIGVHLNEINPIPIAVGDGSSVIIVLWGVVVAILYQKIEKSKMIIVLMITGILLLTFGFWIRQYTGGISKINSTPAWICICTGISLLMYGSLIWLIDIKNKRYYFNLIQPAGTSTLTCYLMPYFLYAIFSLVHFQYPAFMRYGIGGIVKSLFVSVILIVCTGFLEKKKLRLKI